MPCKYIYIYTYGYVDKFDDPIFIYKIKIYTKRIDHLDIKRGGGVAIFLEQKL